MKSLLNLRKRIDAAKERTRKLKESREQILAERYGVPFEDPETEQEKFDRIMDTPDAWGKMG